MGRIAGKKVAGEKGEQRRTPSNAIFQSSAPKQPAALSTRELKRIYSSSSRLTANVDQAHICEMIRRGFFSNGIWLDELSVVESVAKQIIQHRDGRGRTILKADPELWMKAKEIVDLGARVPVTERNPATKGHQKKKLS